MASSAPSFLPILLRSQRGSSLSPLALPAPVLLSPGRYTTILLCSFFTSISSVSSPNSPRPLFALFPFFFSITLPVNTSLSLICFSYSLSHLLLPPPQSPSFYRLSASAVCSPHLFFYLTDLNQTLHCVPISCANIKRQRKMLWEMNWLTAECMWRITPLF